jgi:hypothetical protein
MENTGSRPIKVIQYFPPLAPEDVTIYIQADTGMHGGRENADGRYYTITFPDDYIGTIGTVTDPFKDVRTTSTGPIGLPDGTSQLNVVLNIPEGMLVGANTSNNIISPVDRKDYNPVRWPTSSKILYVTDPSLHIKLNTDQWSETVLAALNIKVNNYGTVIGGGGSGGWGGGENSFSGKGSGIEIKPGGGGGGGQGLHPAWIHGAETEYEAELVREAGQGGEGYNIGGGGIGGDGVPGTLTSNGAGGLHSETLSGGATVMGGGHGHVGGTVIYITSNVYGSVSGTNIDIYNGTTGWISGGAGGAGGGYSLDGGSGGLIGYPTPTYNDVGWGETSQGSGTPGMGGPPGRIYWDVSANLVTSNTKTNDSSNTMYGWDGSWAP